MCSSNKLSTFEFFAKFPDEESTRQHFSVRTGTVTEQHKKLKRRMLSSSSLRRVLPLSVLLGMSVPGYAQEVGDEVINPTTGEAEIVVGTSEDGSVILTDQNNAVLTMTDIGAVFQGLSDPDDPDSAVVDFTVTDQIFNADTMLLEQVSVQGLVQVFNDDGTPELDSDDNPVFETETRVFFVFQSVDPSLEAGGAGTSGAPGGVSMPPIPEGNVALAFRSEGGDGSDGRDGGGIRVPPLVIFGVTIIPGFTIGVNPTEGQDGKTPASINETITGGSLEAVSNGISGISALSLGGDGGQGGDTYVSVGLDAAQGGQAGFGGDITLNAVVNINTSGDEGHGIFAQSASGNGGAGGSGFITIVGSGGTGGPGGAGGDVNVISSGEINTTGNAANGIFAQSLGGGTGDGGSSFGLVGSAGSASVGGDGGSVSAVNNGEINTFGEVSHGVFAQSVGGSGGSAGLSVGVLAFAGEGSGGGDGGKAEAINGEDATVTTSGEGSFGVFAQSIGGSGGNGSTSAGLLAFASSGGGAGNAGLAIAENRDGGSIQTIGLGAHAVFAQSIGGGGGNGGIGGGLVAFGAQGASGGNGGEAVIVNGDNTSIITAENDAAGLFAESIGGGGGNGGIAGGIVGFGGSGSVGGNGGNVTITSGLNAAITTLGDQSIGILGHSVGNGGGNGGLAAGILAFGADGGGGGSGGNVVINAETG